MSQVVVPPLSNAKSPQVVPIQAKGTVKIVSDRVNARTGEEEYLVLWKSRDRSYPPLSWHTLQEVKPVLPLVQTYLENLASQSAFRKRKSPFDEREPDLSNTSDHVTAYNGIKQGKYYSSCVPASETAQDVVRSHIKDIPPPRLLLPGNVRRADAMIRAQFQGQLDAVNRSYLDIPPITLVNNIDNSTPSLRFQFIHQNRLGKGVNRAEEETMLGCQSCSPAMGRNIGCEYTRKCECLEFAGVAEERLTEEQKEMYKVFKETGQGSTLGFPKRFPYYSTDSVRNGCLVTFYLESRHAIYECNLNCPCGEACKTRNVQKGRRVPLEIFKTTTRGWGLRCKTALRKGQFVDTYRGEIITDAETDRREKAGDKGKASYLYSLDKFAESERIAQEDVYVIDGEHFGGPTRFINHSCEPNCRQYTVSYNKYDIRVYEIAFFAYQDISAGEELTFDYLDKDEAEEESASQEPVGDHAIPCNCGAEHCRKWLWR